MESMTNSNGHWLTIEPYVFIFKGKTKYVLYNSLSKCSKKIMVKGNEMIVAVLEQLLKMKNLYAIDLPDLYWYNDQFQQFIQDLKDGYFGDTFSKSLFKYRPISLPPVVKIKNSSQNINQYEELQGNDTYLRFLHELSVYLLGKCELNCAFCDCYYKQVPFCHKSDCQFSEQDLDLLLDMISKSPNLSILNIFGGNVLKYEHLNHLLDEIILISHPVEVRVFVYYKLCIGSDLARLVNQYGIHLHILFDFDDFDSESMSVFNMKSIIGHVTYDFVCKDEEEYGYIIGLINTHRVRDFNIFPFYDNNDAFFRKLVYSAEDEILEAEHSRKNIFAKQLFNVFYYGKMIVSANKQVLDCINGTCIGKIQDGVIELVKKCLNDGSSWFRTRDKLKPCSDCAYRFLCPPPSNYEIAIGKPNLCTVKP